MTYKQKVLLVIVGNIVAILLGLIVCIIYQDIKYHSGTFDIIEEHEYGNGRMLKFNDLEPQFEDKVHPQKKLDTSFSNLYNRDGSGMHYFVDSMNLGIYPLYVHRFSGRVDTLYAAKRETLYSIGYIQRVHYGKKWLVIEVKDIFRTLGYQHLAGEEYKKYNRDCLNLSCYTYEGQRIFFDSDSSDFWIVNRYVTHMYGPLTEAELRTQLKRLHISLPLTLEGMYDRYVYNQQITVEPPKEFHYWHWQERPDRIIQP